MKFGLNEIQNQHNIKKSSLDFSLNSAIWLRIIIKKEQNMFPNKTKILSFVQILRSSYKVLQGGLYSPDLKTLEAFLLLDCPVALLAKHQKDFKQGPNSELISIDEATIKNKSTQIYVVQGNFYFFFFYLIIIFETNFIRWEWFQSFEEIQIAWAQSLSLPRPAPRTPLTTLYKYTKSYFVSLKGTSFIS